LPLKRGHVPSEGGSVHAQRPGELRERNGAGARERDEQGHLGGAEAAECERAIVELGNGPGGAPHGEAGAVGGDVLEDGGVRAPGHVRVYTPIFAYRKVARVSPLGRTSTSEAWA